MKKLLLAVLLSLVAVQPLAAQTQVRITAPWMGRTQQLKSRQSTSGTPGFNTNHGQDWITNTLVNYQLFDTPRTITAVGASNVQVNTLGAGSCDTTEGVSVEGMTSLANFYALATADTALTTCPIHWEFYETKAGGATIASTDSISVKYQGSIDNLHWVDVFSLQAGAATLAGSANARGVAPTVSGGTSGTGMWSVPFPINHNQAWSGTLVGEQSSRPAPVLFPYFRAIYQIQGATASGNTYNVAARLVYPTAWDQLPMIGSQNGGANRDVVFPYLYKKQLNAGTPRVPSASAPRGLGQDSIYTIHLTNSGSFAAFDTSVVFNARVPEQTDASIRTCMFRFFVVDSRLDVPSSLSGQLQGVWAAADSFRFVLQGTVNGSVWFNIQTINTFGLPSSSKMNGFAVGEYDPNLAAVRGVRKYRVILQTNTSGAKVYALRMYMTYYPAMYPPELR